MRTAAPVGRRARELCEREVSTATHTSFMNRESPATSARSVFRVQVVGEVARDQRDQGDRPRKRRDDLYKSARDDLVMHLLARQSDGTRVLIDRVRRSAVARVS